MKDSPASHAPKGENSAADSHEDLLVRIGRDRDRAAFAALFAHFAPRVKSFLMKGGFSEGEADELAQETMLTVWNRADSYNPALAGASTWIFTIARNKKLDVLRKTTRYEFNAADPLLQASDEPHPDEQVSRARETEIIGRALRDLPEDQASLLYKSFFEDKTHQDIARETRLPLGTVKSRIRLALEKLRRQTGVKALWN